ncbi:MAG: alcohol dehydrogenase catalytic domain-containing protein [Ruminococcus sp.]|nr:alcohol dehydrogenase catalytic domain-containing protein [Ruminococcus sp.]
MEKKMRAMIIETPGGGRKATKITDVPYPKCGPKQIIVKVMAASICKHCEAGYDQGKMQLTKAEDYPITLGHEFAGEVVEIGENVKNVKVGDRVTVDNTVLCGECYYCQRNQPLYCENFGSMGHNIHGGFEQYVAALAEKAFLIPREVSYEEAACTEPVACCMRTLDRMDLTYGDRVAVMGAGSMGLILAQLIRHTSASQVVVLASTQSKLDLCEKEFGIRTVLVDRQDYTKHEKAIAEMFPHGLDFVVDTTGSAAMCNSALRMLGKGGKLMEYTVVDSFAIEDAWQFASKELSIIVSWCQTHNYGRCIDAIAKGYVNLKPLITHEFSLEDYLEALDTNLKDRNSIKVLIHPHWEKGKKIVHI